MVSGLPFDYDMIVIDELSSFKSYQAKRFRSLLKARPAVQRIVGLTGTPSTNQDIDTLVDLKRDIVLLVKSVSNTEYQTLLEKRYLCFMTWEQIAVDMNYNKRYVLKLHKEALAICDTLLDRALNDTE